MKENKYIKVANLFMEKDLLEQGDELSIDIFFDNLDEETQKTIMESLRESLNVAEDDEYAKNKIIETLAKYPLFSLRTNELIKQMNFDF
jgi:hypothetical protein